MLVSRDDEKKKNGGSSGAKSNQSVLDRMNAVRDKAVQKTQNTNRQYNISSRNDFQKGNDYTAVKQRNNQRLNVEETVWDQYEKDLTKQYRNNEIRDDDSRLFDLWRHKAEQNKDESLVGKLDDTYKQEYDKWLVDQERQKFFDKNDQTRAADRAKKLTKEYDSEFKSDSDRQRILSTDYESKISDYEKRIKELNDYISETTTQVDNGFLSPDALNSEDFLKAQSDLRKLNQEYGTAREEADQQNNYFENTYYSTLLENGTEKEKKQAAGVINSYDDGFWERIGKGTEANVKSLGQTALALYDTAKDVLYERSAEGLVYDAEQKLASGEYSQEQYDKLMDKAKEVKNFQANDPANLSQQLREEIDYMNREIAYGTEGVEKFAIDSINGTTNFLMQYALLGEVGSLLSMSAMSGTQKYYQLLDEGYDADTAFLNASATAFVSYMTEKIGMDHFVSVLNGTANQSFFGQIINSLSKSGIANYYIQSIASGAMAEGLEEGVEGLADPIVDWLTLGTPIEYNGGEIFYAMLVGAGSGALMSGLASVRGANFVLNTKQQYNQLKADLNTAREIRNNPDITPDQARVIDELIAKAELSLNNFAENAPVAMSVNSVEDAADVSTKADGDEALAKAVYPNAREIADISKRLNELSQRIDNVSEAFLRNNNVDADINDFMDTTKEDRKQILEAADYATKLNVEVTFQSDESIKEQLAESMRRKGKSEADIRAAITNPDLFADGYVKDGKIVLNMTSHEGQLSTLVHELTHKTENSEHYNELHRLVQEYLGNDNYNKRLSKIRSMYDGVADDPEHELVAKVTQDALLLGNREFLDNLVRYHESLAYRLFKGIQSMTTKDSKVKMENAFMEAFRDAGKNAEAQFFLDTKGEEIAVDEKTAIERAKRILDMPPVHTVIGNRFSKDQGKLSQTVSAFFKTLNNRVVRDGVGTIRLNDNGVQSLIMHFPRYIDRYASVEALPDVIQKGEIIKANNNWKGRNYDTIIIAAPIKIDASESGTARTKYMAVSIKQYKSGINEYDIHDLIMLDEDYVKSDKYKKTNISLNQEAGFTATDMSEYTYNLLKRAQEVNPNLRPDGSRKDLRAVHNLSADNLRRALDFDESLVMPSIAVTKDGISHEGYGDISLVFDENTIDPKRKENKVFTRDAWTPRFPDVDYKLNNKVVNSIRSRVEELVSKSVNPSSIHSLLLDENNFGDLMRRGNGNVAEAYKDSLPLKIAYLNDIGEGYEMPTKHKDLGGMSHMDDDVIRRASEILRERNYDFSDRYGDVDAETEEALRSLVYDNFYRNYYDRMLERSKENPDSPWLRNKTVEQAAQQMTETTMKNRWTPFTARDIINDARYYLENGESNVPDVRKAEEELKNLSDDQRYHDWIYNLFNGVIEKRGVRNGKDTFTRTGNRRSFESLHDEYTPQGVLNNMLSRQNEESWGGYYNFNYFLGTTSDNFNSVQDIIDNEYRLKENGTEIDSYNELSNRYHQFVESLKRSYDSNDPFWDSVAFDGAMEEAIGKIKRGASDESVLKTFNEDYRFKATTEQVRELRSLIDEGKKITTDYFEAKPRRVVKISEAKQAYVPNTTDPSLIQRLQDLGVEVIQYDKNKSGDRQAKMNGENGTQRYQFSLGMDNSIARRNQQNSETLQDNGYTEEQADAISSVAGIRHDIHSGMQSYWNGNEDLQSRLDEINSTLEDNGLPTIEFPDIDLIPSEQDYDYLLDEDEQNDWERRAEEEGYSSGYEAWFHNSGEYERFADVMEDINTRIEDYLRDIDRQNGTNYAPSGYARQEWAGKSTRFSLGETKARDAEYLKAVESGDMDTAQKMVDEEAKEKGAMTFPNGRVKTYYHGTSASFTSFDIEESRYGNYGFGFYFSPMVSKASEYGKLIPAYLMTDRIATHRDHSIAPEQVETVMERYNVPFDVTIGRYADSIEEWVNHHDDMAIALELQRFIIQRSKYGDEVDNMLQTFRTVFGYDGLRQTNETVIWDNRLIKSADPVTYDNNGNVIPLSQRFNSKSNDIRFSLGENLTDEQREEVERIKAKNRKSHSKKDALLLRDAGEKLSESDFYKVYSAHKLNMRRFDENTVDEIISKIKTEGFKGDAGFGINVMPAMINNGIKEWNRDSYTNYRREMYRQYGLDESNVEKDWDDFVQNYSQGWVSIDGSLYDLNYSQTKYGVRKGEKVLLVPDSWVVNDEKVKNGFIPFDYEIVKAERNFQPYYELYSKAYDEAHGNGDTKFSLGEYDSSKSVKQNYDRAVENNDRELAEQCVERAAKKWGAYLDEKGKAVKLYHGTDAFGFTAFDMNEMDDKRSIFLTNRVDTAKTYSGSDTVQGINDYREVNPERVLEELRSTGEGNTRSWDYLSPEEVVKFQNDLIADLEMWVTDEFAPAVANLTDGQEKEFGNSILSTVGSNSNGYTIANQIMNARERHPWIESVDGFDTALYQFNLAEELGLIGDNFDPQADGAYLLTYPAGRRLEASVYSLADVNDILRRNGRKTFEQKGEKRAIYSLYAKLENPLIIDADGDNWNRIRIPDEIREQFWEYLEPPYDWQNDEYLSPKHAKTREFSEYADYAGYDGVIFKNLQDHGGKMYTDDAVSDVYIVFNPNNVKSADPFTYDDKGNLIPLEERFNSKKNELRFSLGEVTDEKKKNLHPTIVRDFARTLEMSQDSDNLNKALIEAMESGEVSQETRDKLVSDYADIVEKTSVNESAKEAADIYKKLRNYTKKTKININSFMNTELRNDKFSKGGYGEFADKDEWTDFRRRNFDKFTFSQKSGMDIDSFFKEFNEMFPNMLDAETVGGYGQLHAIANLMNSLKEQSKESYQVGDEEFSQIETWVNGEIDKMIDSTERHKKFLEEAERLEVSQKELDGLIRQNGVSAKTMERLDKEKQIFIDNAREWIPDYDIIREKYDTFSEKTLNTAMYESLMWGEPRDSTMEDMQREILEDMFGYTSPEMLENVPASAREELDDIINDILVYFSLDAKYKANKKFIDPAVTRANNVAKAYGESGKMDEEVEKQKEILDTIKEAEKYKQSFSDRDLANDVINRGKDKVSYFKTLEQNLDYIADGDQELRDALRARLEVPRSIAQLRRNAIRNDGQNVLNQLKELGITGGSEESKIAQFWKEKHTNERQTYDTKNRQSREEARKHPWKAYTQEQFNEDTNYKMKNGKTAKENIEKATKIIDDAYHKLILDLNASQLRVYGDVLGQNEYETAQLKAKLETSAKLVADLKEQMKTDPSLNKQAAYNKAVKEYNQLINQFNAKMENDASNDSTRRRFTPIRSNYAHHVRKAGIVNDIKSIFKENVLPTQLSGLTADVRPNTAGAGFMWAQDGGDYDADIVESFANYVQDASKVIAYNEYIADLRQFAKDIRAEATGTEMSRLAGYIDQYANDIAGKRQDIDRYWDEKLPKFGKFIRVANSMGKRAALMFNVSSALVQIANVPNGMGILARDGVAGNADAIKGMTDYVSSFRNEGKRSIIDQSPFISDRFFDFDTYNRTGKAVVNNIADTMMTALDEAGTKMIWWGGYEQAVRKGMEGMDAILYADDVARRAVAGRGVGEVPLGLRSAFVNTIMPFQIENNNSWQTMKQNMKGKNGSALLTTFVMSFLVNALLRYIKRDDALAEPLSPIINEMLGDDGLIASLQNSDNKAKAWEDYLTNVGRGELGEFINSMPAGSLLTSLSMSQDKANELFGDYNPSRYGSTNIGLSGLGNVAYDLGTGDTAKAVSDFVGGYVPGGKQLTKTVGGLQSEGVLPKYLSDKDTWGFSPVERRKDGKIKFVNDPSNVFDFMRATLFGKWATKPARDYIDSGFKTWSATKENMEKTADSIGLPTLGEKAEGQVTQESAQALKDWLKEQNKWDEYVDQIKSDYEKSDGSKTFAQFANTYGLTKKSLEDETKDDFYKSYYDTYKVSDKDKGTFQKAMDLDGVYKDSKGNVTDDRKTGSKKVANSEAIETRKALEDMGQYENVLEYIEQNGLNPSEFGLTNTVIGWDDDKFEAKYNDMYGTKQTESTNGSSTRSTGRRSSSTMNASTIQSILSKMRTQRFNKTLDLLDDLLKSSRSSRKM